MHVGRRRGNQGCRAHSRVQRSRRNAGRLREVVPHALIKAFRSLVGDGDVHAEHGCGRDALQCRGLKMFKPEYRDFVSKPSRSASQVPNGVPPLVCHVWMVGQVSGQMNSRRLLRGCDLSVGTRRLSGCATGHKQSSHEQERRARSQACAP